MSAGKNSQTSNSAQQSSVQTGSPAQIQSPAKSKSSTVSQSSAQDNSKKVGVIGLVGVVISAMVGGGIYDLPQNMAESAGPGAQVIAWVITGVGMWFIANTFRILAQVRPELKDGLFNYAYQGFGKFVGFLIAYGYWICNSFAMVAYGVLIMSTMNYFFPGAFPGGNNVWSIVCASAISWVMFFLSLRGAKSSAFLNVIGTVAKLVPILVFVVACLTIFKFSTFLHGFWGLTQAGVPLKFDLGNVMKQVSPTMLVTLWLFIGIEGAVVISGEAKSQKDVAKATTVGYVVVLVMYVLVSLLPLGISDYHDVAKLSNPSMAALMEQHWGAWGAILVNVGVIVSVLAAWLVWMIMLGQMPLFAARAGLFPKAFTKVNSKNAPTVSLFWAAVVCQVLFVLCLFVSGNAWNTMISITSVMAMPCYLLCCAYLWKISVKDPWPAGVRFHKANGMATGVLGTCFALYLVYSAGLDYLMIACILYAIGIPIFIVGRRQSEETALGESRPGVLGLFTNWEKALAVIVMILGVVGIFFTVRDGIFG